MLRKKLSLFSLSLSKNGGWVGEGKTMLRMVVGNGQRGKTGGGREARRQPLPRSPSLSSRQKAQLLAILLGQPDQALHLLVVHADGLAKLFDD